MFKPMIALILSAFILSSTAKETSMNMRTGLWEITTTSDLLLLARHIPKEQLAGIAQIAKKYGLNMPKLESGAAISNTCITKKMAELQTIPQLYQEDLGCTTNHAKRYGSRYKANFSCNSTKLKGQGSAEGQIVSSTSFTGFSYFKGIAQGISVNEKAAFSGKWLKAGCG